MKSKVVIVVEWSRVVKEREIKNEEEGSERKRGSERRVRALWKQHVISLAVTSNTIPIQQQQQQQQA